jgi:hypothetical protein
VRKQQNRIGCHRINHISTQTNPVSCCQPSTCLSLTHHHIIIAGRLGIVTVKRTSHHRLSKLSSPLKEMSDSRDRVSEFSGHTWCTSIAQPLMTRSLLMCDIRRMSSMMKSYSVQIWLYRLSREERLTITQRFSSTTDPAGDRSLVQHDGVMVTSRVRRVMAQGWFLSPHEGGVFDRHSLADCCFACSISLPLPRPHQARADSRRKGTLLDPTWKYLSRSLLEQM